MLQMRINTLSIAMCAEYEFFEKGLKQKYLVTSHHIKTAGWIIYRT